MGEPSLHVALLEPKIPQNTGSIGRLTLGLGARLHLVGPLGFSTDEKACRRAGLDYWKHVDWVSHTDLEALRRALPPEARLIAFSARAERPYTDLEYRAGDCLLFGDEVLGLPAEVVAAAGELAVRIPLQDPRVRSLNLACAVAMGLGEALRQVRPAEASCRPS
jgi:tRNA (cytidine/uridine-2'-O-)-methyltransferase